MFFLQVTASVTMLDSAKAMIDDKVDNNMTDKVGLFG
jgi:hypothetical protein